MVRGIEKFKEYFGVYPENYVIIGGTACDVFMENAGFTPRATKDIDIILVVEALNADFVRTFWRFIKDGQYERQEKSADDRKYYRFVKPEDTRFPFQLELFSRMPDRMDLQEPAHLTPIPVDDDLSSLSAILLSDDYYDYMLDHSVVENGVRLANLEALICLKAKAYIKVRQRIEEGSKEDARHLKKHKNDVFKLAVMLPVDSVFFLPEGIKRQFTRFTELIKDELPDKQIYKDMGVGAIQAATVFEQLKKAFLADKKG